MQKITPHLWFDEARGAAKWYVSLFPDSRIINVTESRTRHRGLGQFQSIRTLWHQVRHKGGSGRGVGATVFRRVR